MDYTLEVTMKFAAPIIAVFFLSLNAHAADFVTPLMPQQTMLPGDRMFSNNGQFRFDFQADGNLVVYRTLNNTATWSSNTAGIRPLWLSFGDRNDTLNQITCTGGVGVPHPADLGYYFRNNVNNKASLGWCARGSGLSPARHIDTYLVLQDDGSLVLWQSQKGVLCTLTRNECIKRFIP